MCEVPNSMNRIDDPEPDERSNPLETKRFTAILGENMDAVEIVINQFKFINKLSREVETAGDLRDINDLAKEYKLFLKNNKSEIAMALMSEWEWIAARSIAGTINRVPERINDAAKDIYERTKSIVYAMTKQQNV